jgi:hypothetical protein
LQAKGHFRAALQIIPEVCHAHGSSVAAALLLVRLKATLERMQRFSESYLELLLKLLPPVAEALGKALGVAPYAIQTFTEAEIRANVVFQVPNGCLSSVYMILGLLQLYCYFLCKPICADRPYHSATALSIYL